MFYPPLIPVTGLTKELFLIPVNGVDLADTNEIGLMEAALFMSVMVLGTRFIILRTNKQKEHWRFLIALLMTSSPSPAN